jgi:cell division septation protein DedD
VIFFVFFSGTLFGYTLSSGPDQGFEAGAEPVHLAQVAAAVPACVPEDRMAMEAEATVLTSRARPPLTLPTVTVPEPAPAPPEATASPAEPIKEGRYAVQVGAFGVRANADALAEDLRARGYEPLIIAAQNRRGDWLEHVHLSVHADEAGARAVAEAFSRSEQLTAVVVPAPRFDERR